MSVCDESFSGGAYETSNSFQLDGGAAFDIHNNGFSDESMVMTTFVTHECYV